MEQRRPYDRPGKRQAKRYKTLGARYLSDALVEMRHARWQQAEELLWGSLAATIKAVAWSRGVDLQASSQVEEWAASLARETKDRRIRDAFSRLSGLSTLFDRVHDSRVNAERLLLELDEVESAVRRMWQLIPSGEEA